MLTPEEQARNIQAASSSFKYSNNKIIRYKTTDGQPLPDNDYVANNTLIENTYKDGEGRLVYKKLVSNVRSFMDTNISEVTLPEDVVLITDGAFNNCHSLEHIDMPEGIMAIENDAFMNCADLVLTKLPGGLSYISDSAFSGCSKITITEIPAGVSTIFYQAFWLCDLMTDVKILRTESKVEGDSRMFNSGTTIRVPNALLAEYQADENWNVYNLVGYDPE